MLFGVKFIMHLILLNMCVCIGLYIAVGVCVCVAYYFEFIHVHQYVCMQAENALNTEQQIPLMSWQPDTLLSKHCPCVCVHVCIIALTCGPCMNTHNVQVYTTQSHYVYTCV